MRSRLLTRTPGAPRPYDLFANSLYEDAIEYATGRGRTLKPLPDIAAPPLGISLKAQLSIMDEAPTQLVGQVDPREIKTKFRKAIQTVFYPVGEDIAAIVCGWVRYLLIEKLYGVRPDDHRSFAVRGLTREHWANAATIRLIFRTAFARVDLPYVKPHSIRDTLTQLPTSCNSTSNR